MKTFKVTNRGQKVTSPEGEIFQLVEIEINFYGNITTNTYDTRIVNGVQTVIDGDGFIPNNTII